MAAHGKRRQRTAEGVVADRVIDDIGARAAGHAHDRLGEIFAGVDDDMVRAEPLDDPRLVVARHRGDHGRAEMAGPLHQQLADAAGRGMDEDDVARLHGVDVMQQETGGDALQQAGSGDLVANIVREMNQQFGRHDAPLAIGADRRTGIGDAVADRQSPTPPSRPPR